MAVNNDKIYVADFETTTDLKDCRVWGACVYKMDNCSCVHLSNNIDDFMLFTSKLKNGSLIYFHNLKFDGKFILSWLLTSGFIFSDDSYVEKSFRTIITDSGQWYQIEVTFKVTGVKRKNAHKILFQDSMKKLNFPVRKIAEMFELPISKGEIDYNKYRPLNHVLTDEEISYIKRDVEIVTRGINLQYLQGLNKMTTSSDALSSYKKSIGGESQFLKLFPILSISQDEIIRKAYKGGWTYLKKGFSEKIIGEGCAYDVNSLYPSVMYNEILPYGFPKSFDGEYSKDDNYPLFIQFMSCQFKIKKNHLPCIQIKNSGRFVETEYLTSSGSESVELVVTSVDLNLYKEHYEFYNVEYHGGFMFKGKVGLFNLYIDYWSDIKANSTGGLRQQAKLMLNSLYGKFATSPIRYKKTPYLENGVVKFRLNNEPEIKEPIYTAMACFITAYSRSKTIRTAQSVYERFIYADTDSIHLIGKEVPAIEIHDTKLGAWKHEGNFTKAKFIRAKTYMELYEGCEKPEVKCAGLPDICKKDVTFENFKKGAKFYGKLAPKTVEGGVILIETEFTIK